MAKKTADITTMTGEAAPETTPGPDYQGAVALKTYATKVELGLGCHLLGQTLTMSSQHGTTLEVTEYGVKATSKTGREVLVPWSNTRCVELKPAKVSKAGRQIHPLK